MPRYSDRTSVYDEGSIPMNPVKRRSARMPWVIGALALILLVGCGVLGGIVLQSAPEKGPSVPLAPTVVANPPVKSRPAPAVQAKPKGVIEGSYSVGEDLAPGRYRTKGAAEGAIVLCYWEVRTDGQPDGPIGQQGAVNGFDEQSDVTLKKGQYFKTAGCKPWVKR